MTDLEERLTNELSKLAAQYAQDQKRLDAQVALLAEQQESELKRYIEWNETLGGQVTHLGEQVQQLADRQATDLKGYIEWSENMGEQHGILREHVEKLTKAHYDLTKKFDGLIEAYNESVAAYNELKNDLTELLR